MILYQDLGIQENIYTTAKHWLLDLLSLGNIII